MNNLIFDFRFLIFDLRNEVLLPVVTTGLIFIFSFSISAQKVAIITPENSDQDIKFAGKLSENLAEQLKLINSSLSETAFQGAGFENPFNLSLEESKNVGAAIGCNFFLLVKSVSTRRESLDKPIYYEAYAVMYLVSSRTGRLIFWKLESRQADKSEKAEKLLFNSVNQLAKEIVEKVKISAREELNEKPASEIEEVPEENSLESKNLRVPLPYRRIKPDYTPTAYLYNIKATIDVFVDIDAAGNILRIEVNRWAGFGLDESVIGTIRKMNWRPAERNNKTLPMRVLLRYNFKKIEKVED